MEADDIRAFARRDWDAVAESKADFWAGPMRAMTAGEALGVAEFEPLLADHETRRR